MLKDYLKTVPQFILPKHTITRLASVMANIKSPAIKNRLIRHFIKTYGVDMSEALRETVEQYTDFNDFFIRKLRPGCRPLADADIVSPVDGVVSEIGYMEEGHILQAKGRYYTVDALLACEEALSAQFAKGAFATLYLSPKDYHRIHMPMDAQLQKMVYVPGKLFSVQPTTARVVPQLFARNERLVLFFTTEVGLMAMVFVGATIVGAIGTRWHGDLKRSKQKQIIPVGKQLSDTLLRQGDEVGYFKLGSTVVLLFAHGEQIQWNKALRAGSALRYGEAIASLR
ncbi:MAG: archaetidylserine decarboxylase [Tatlockia sp.]|jgi:phosphatidylserine decarboxylase